jgi:hypothetical protein
MVTRWTFFDPIVNETYTVPINPNSGDAPAFVKSLDYQASAAPDGKTLVFEGRAEPRKLEMGGVVLERAHLEALEYWTKKRNRVVITDDMGRSFTVYITDFTPTREPRRSHPWRHTYQMSALLLEP